MRRAAEDSVFAKQREGKRTPPSAASLPVSLGSACLDSRICLSMHQPGYFLGFQRLRAVRKLGLQSQARRSGRAFGVHLSPTQVQPMLTSPHHPPNAANSLPCPLAPFPRMPTQHPLPGSPPVRLVQNTPTESSGQLKKEERGRQERGFKCSHLAKAEKRKQRKWGEGGNQRGMRNINSYHLTSKGFASQSPICANLLQG